MRTGAIRRPLAASPPAGSAAWSVAASAAPPAASASAAPSLSPLARQFASALTRAGFDDSVATGSKKDGSSGTRSSTDPRPELVAEVDWLEGALGGVEPAAAARVRDSILQLQPQHVLTPDEIKSYQILQQSKRVIHDPLELSQAMEAMGLQDTAEEEDLEAMEREIAALTAESSALDARISSLQLSRSEYNAQATQLSEQRAELERVMDAEADRATRLATSSGGTGASTSASRIHSEAELANEVSALSRQTDEALDGLAEAAAQVKSLLAHGRYASTEQRTTKGRLLGAPEAGPVGYASALPTLAATSALDSDEFMRTITTTNAMSTPALADSAVARSQASDASLVSDNSDSPFVDHHPAALAHYAALDDTWARTLNQLFRAQFGAPVSEKPSTHATASGPAGSPQTSRRGGRMASTLRALEEDEEQDRAMLSVLSATPHAKHLRTPTVERGKLLPRTGKKGGPTERQEEEKSNDALLSPGPPAPLTASSLTPDLHARFSAELSRLYDSFPESQNYWLLSNLSFLSVKARIQAQHASMVGEAAARSLTKQQLNESMAEQAIQHRNLAAQLSTLLNDTFPALWADLRALQLLEVLRVDLDFKYRRQEEYVAAQREVLRELLGQRARHEMLLGAERWAHARLQSLHALLTACWEELRSTQEGWEKRLDAYKHVQRLHEHSASMVSPAKLTVDGRARILARVAAMADSAARSMARTGIELRLEAVAASVAPTGTQAAVAVAGYSSFDALLSTAQTLSTFEPRARVASAARAQSRAQQLQSLSARAASARALLFDDARDVELPAPADAASGGATSAATANEHRVERDAFNRQLARAQSAVDTAASKFNSVLAAQAEAQAKLSAKGGAAGLGSVESTLRTVWCEFIQAPDVLESRVQKLQQRLRGVQAKVTLG